MHRTNPDERARRTWDKVNVHLTFSSAGLQTPDTIILPSYEEQPLLPPIDLRLQPKAFDGIPDEIVHDIVRSLATLVADHCQPPINHERLDTLPPQVAQSDDIGLVGETRIEYILEELRNASLHVEPYRSSGADINFIVRVAGRDVMQNSLHPFVCISVSRNIMNSCETNFVSSVTKGMEICQHIIRQPPNKTRA